MKSKITIFSLALFMSLSALFLPLQPAFAASAPKIPTPTPTPTQTSENGGFVPCGNTANNPCNISHLFKAFVVIVNYLIVMAGFIAVAAIVYAGLLMVSSQGEERLVQAKKRLSGAIIGMIIVAGAFILINALFSGSLSIGVKNGGTILSNPKAYINGQ